MKSLIYLFVTFLAISTNANDKVVFMQENADQKQIMQASADGSAIKQLTKGKDWHLYPDISPDGQWLTYVKGPDAQSLHVVVQNLITNRKEIWTATPGFFLHPKFSQNAGLLFFSGQFPKNNTQKLAKIDLISARKLLRPNEIQIDGETFLHYQASVKLVEEEYPAFFPTPSADGTFMYYQRNHPQEGRQIVLKHFVNKTTEVLAKGMAPSLSFDEKYVAFTSQQNSFWNILVYDRFEKKTYQITQSNYKDFAPTFRANGDLVFASDRQYNHFNLYAIKKQQWLNGSRNTYRLSDYKMGDHYAPQFSGPTNYKQALLREIPGEPRSSFGTIYHKNLIFVAGGHQGPEHTYPPESFTNRVQVYDTKTGNWKDVAPRLHKAHGFSLAAYGNYIYAFGGFAYSANHNPKWQSLDVIERYDIKLNKWEVIGHMPRKRSSYVIVQDQDKAYIIGGWNSTPKFDNDLDGKFHDEIDVFDFKTETMVEADYKLPAPKRRAFTGVMVNGKIILLGGISEGAGHFSLLDNVTQIDPLTGKHKELNKMPFGTFAPAAGVVQNKLYVFGGMFKTGKWTYEYVPHIYGMDLVNQHWDIVGRYLNESKGFSQVVPYNDSSVCILGGHSYQNQTDKPVATVEIFGL